MGFVGDGLMNSINYTSNGLNKFNADPRFAGIDGNGQTIAVFDFGFKLDHPGFGEDKDKDGAGDRIIRRDLDFQLNSNNNASDGHYHGTVTTGVVASGAKGVKILPIQIGSSVEALTQAIQFSTAFADKYKISVISISMSDARNTLDNLPTPATKSFYTAVGLAEKAGITVVTAAGNGGLGGYREPGTSGLASLTNVIGVSNANSNGLVDAIALSPSSQRSPTTIAAPGNGVMTFNVNNGYSVSGGTSIATPFMASSIGLLQGVAERYLGRKLQPSEVKSLLQQTDTGLVGSPGYTQVNVFNAADLIYRIGTGNAPDTLSKVLLTNEKSVLSTAPTKYAYILQGTNYIDVLTGRSTSLNTFDGCAGRDFLVGGQGVNIFKYNSLSDSGDTLLKFTPGKDKINVTQLMKSISYTGTNPLVDQRITLGSSENGLNTVVNVDKDGAGPLAPQELLTIANVNAYLINSSSFVI